MSLDELASDQLMEHALAEKLGRASRLWRSVADRGLHPLGLTHPRWTALWKLARLEGEVTQKRLAEALEIELPSLMRTLGQLEEQGYIIRHISPHDKRARIVCMTEQGAELLGEIAQRILKIRRALLKNIDECQLKEFEAVLAQLSSNALSLDKEL
ncbi:MarR family transcriptional regulator [Celerinatantimonas diazotrophica]|uniref:MarR family transcriptional regulator for hemolysin n=1 Tax=Celerinatantimonas diazotrophica TaxID=412034 RepID=A0A4R1J8V1_9GAMM|nr:MarR family transcriptional regulator [Celerinatantimonas diazotrophica]TCK46774.1 MarR family transcriptional regulator for hemolysin [Celerinatantimonas diazotrophica]CAG9295477.1 Transcriptional regulator SlyA [Celerinatantimonas diazotrophica]